MANNPPNRWRDQMPAADFEYTPTTLADWDGAADPGGARDAFDQLAERAADVEGFGRRIQVTPGLEAADVIAISIQFNDATNAAVTAAHKCLVSIYQDETLWTPEADAAFTLTDGGAGTIDATVVGAPQKACTTDATGLLELDCTDVVGASGSTVYCYVQPLDDGAGSAPFMAPVRVAVTFD